jgi:hypothetical protein
MNSTGSFSQEKFQISMQFMSRCSIPAAILWIVSVSVTAAHPGPMECWRANNYVCPATFVSMIITRIAESCHMARERWRPVRCVTVEPRRVQPAQHGCIPNM